ncbi:hypothetical protein BU23DRAFT_633146 [Bimuria novae-zelandiae CBS 107.79]|uniref:Uncharacterized protein n=1 Tax=Bimuria novae-zelandiae CBS 107.79 TaxID=1447943 RepID=A0A6A5UHQ4_9PLEO|nr:hypothetical protein BU23DRAFT_633146 [Bimuria novae-zelandiae CBS 107.79]
MFLDVNQYYYYYYLLVTRSREPKQSNHDGVIPRKSEQLDRLNKQPILRIPIAPILYPSTFISLPTAANQAYCHLRKFAIATKKPRRKRIPANKHAYYRCRARKHCHTVNFRGHCLLEPRCLHQAPTSKRRPFCSWRFNTRDPLVGEENPAGWRSLGHIYMTTDDPELEKDGGLVGHVGVTRDLRTAVYEDFKGPDWCRRVEAYRAEQALLGAAQDVRATYGPVSHPSLSAPEPYDHHGFNFQATYGPAFHPSVSVAEPYDHYGFNPQAIYGPASHPSVGAPARYDHHGFNPQATYGPASDPPIRPPARYDHHGFNPQVIYGPASPNLAGSPACANKRIQNEAEAQAVLVQEVHDLLVSGINKEDDAMMRDPEGFQAKFEADFEADFKASINLLDRKLCEPDPEACSRLET